MELNKVYFFTATIHHWIPIFEQEGYKEVLLSSLRFLTGKGLLKVYGFVIMPNHIHLIWELLEMNGKELPHASFMKFTSHEFLKKMRSGNTELLRHFVVDQGIRAHLFWQRDSLPIEVHSPKVVFQKLDYIHRNPCKGKWMLAENPLLYPYSSYEFYETGEDRFGFLTHVGIARRL
ncbi:transposase [Algoriphagus aestuariicola]|uniref:Transposase n=1 Tax=Algoriphagus aestuariicola TaxID=1852016 RepID=A0ABS3BMM2_9BACT|nr:transposase [Algoriphagus aestuariicola]MBN7799590.1 transposase [Algoriphagus aestuariicola]